MQPLYYGRCPRSLQNTPMTCLCALNRPLKMVPTLISLTLICNKESSGRSRDWALFFQSRISTHCPLRAEVVRNVLEIHLFPKQTAESIGLRGIPRILSCSSEAGDVIPAVYCQLAEKNQWLDTAAKLSDPLRLGPCTERHSLSSSQPG